MNSDTVKGEASEQPVLAICYDFDKTLSPDDMQAQGYIQSVGYDTEAFWREANLLAQNNDMDPNLAYMYLMVRDMKETGLRTKKTAKAHTTPRIIINM